MGLHATVVSAGTPTVMTVVRFVAFVILPRQIQAIALIMPQSLPSKLFPVQPFIHHLPIGHNTASILKKALLSNLRKKYVHIHSHPCLLISRKYFQFISTLYGL
jgi:hypothetical protein